MGYTLCTNTSVWLCTSLAGLSSVPYGCGGPEWDTGPLGDGGID